MTLKIWDETNQVYVDILPFVAYQGVKWQGSSIDGEDAGRGLDGTMYRDKRADKVRLDVTCLPLKLSDASRVLSLIKPEWIYVCYTDPEAGGDRFCWMYSNNKPASFMQIRDDGEYWNGITFPLIEQ